MDSQDATLVLSKLPKLASKSQIQAILRQAAGLESSMPSKKGLDVDVSCHELKSKGTKVQEKSESKKKLVKKKNKVEVEARKLVFFCAWIKDVVEEEELQTIGDGVVQYLKQRVKIIEEQKEMSGELVETHVQPNGAVRGDIIMDA